MATTIDGPAAGRWFTGDRWPKLLRIARDAAGEWRALTAFADNPHPGERVWLYRRRPAPVSALAPDGRTIVLAEYEHVSEPVPADVFRTAPAWRAWAVANETRLVEPEPCTDPTASESTLTTGPATPPKTSTGKGRRV